MSIELLAIGYDQRPRDSELMALQVRAQIDRLRQPSGIHTGVHVV